jgi:hypothetical protein
MIAAELSLLGGAAFSGYGRQVGTISVLFSLMSSVSILSFSCPPHPSRSNSISMLGGMA